MTTGFKKIPYIYIPSLYMRFKIVILRYILVHVYANLSLIIAYLAQDDNFSIGTLVIRLAA